MWHRISLRSSTRLLFAIHEHERTRWHGFKTRGDQDEFGAPRADRYRDADRAQSCRQPASRAAGADEAHGHRGGSGEAGAVPALRRQRLYHRRRSYDRRRGVAVSGRAMTTEASLFGLTGKKAMVIGGGQGMGESTSRFLARVGCNVAVIDIERERAERVAGVVNDLGRRGVPVIGDVLDDPKIPEI